MNYKEAVEYLNSFNTNSPAKWNKNFGLSKVKFLLEKLGNPHEGMKYVHVTGTSGKSSTSTFIASILTEAGYKAGLQTSPHVLRVNERLKINGKDISDDKFAEILTGMKSVLDSMENEFGAAPSYFEILTAISFLYFKQENCDACVIEVGIGGRIDSTNVIDSHYQIITNVGLDHVGILGNTREEILKDKREIIKNNSIVISGIKDEAMRDIVREKIHATNSKIFFLQRDFNYSEIREEIEKGIKFNFVSNLGELNDLEIKLNGIFQVENASLATMIALQMQKDFSKINEEAIRKGLSLTNIIGRFQIVSHDPLIIVDGAHNAEKVNALVNSISRAIPEKKFITIFRYKNRADVHQSLKTLEQISEKIIEVKHEDNLETAYNSAMLLSQNKNLGILVTGSFYTVGDFLNLNKAQ